MSKVKYILNSRNYRCNLTNPFFTHSLAIICRETGGCFLYAMLCQLFQEKFRLEDILCNISNKRNMLNYI